MATPIRSIPCPRCGATMNRHAEKPREPRTPEEGRLADAMFRDVLEEQHLCPVCGTVVTRVVSFSPER